MEKTKKYKVSVIVPFYHDERYIPECLESLEKQTLSDFEVILIDDCGGDGSSKIVDSWARECESDNFDVVKIKNKTNIGASATRNKGIEAARGKYIMFLDADDILRKDALSKIYWKMSEADLDDLYFNAHSFYESLASHRAVRENYDNRHDFAEVYDGKSLFALMVNSGEFFPQGALRAYKRSFLISNNLSLMDGNIHEDLLLLIQAITKSERTSFLNEPIYLRRVHCGSISASRKRTLRNVDGHFQSLKWFHDWFASNGEKQEDGFRQAYNIFMEKYGKLAARDICYFVSQDDFSAYLSSLDERDRNLFEKLIVEPYIAEYKKNPNTSLAKKIERYFLLPFRGAREVFLYLKEKD